MELLENYSINQIIIIVVGLALAIKGIISFWDWASERLRKVFHKELAEEQRNDVVDAKFDEYDSKLNKIISMIENNQANAQRLNERVNILVDSDRDDIKSFLTREHHYFCYQKKWIDDYSLECCEKRFKHYTDEHGNSFIAGFNSVILFISSP